MKKNGVYPEHWTLMRKQIDALKVGESLTVAKVDGASAHCTKQRVEHYHNYTRSFSTHRVAGGIKILRNK
jgi:hypothetical protein